MSNTTNLFNYYCLSQYDLDGNYTYDSKKMRYTLKSIHSIYIYAPECNDSETDLFFALPEKREIHVKSYDDKFHVIQIGKAKRLWFPNQVSFDMVEDALVTSNGILAYWDSRSIAFVVRNEELLQVVNDFLKDAPYIGYFKDNGGVLIVK